MAVAIALRQKEAHGSASMFRQATLAGLATVSMAIASHWPCRPSCRLQAGSTATPTRSRSRAPSLPGWRAGVLAAVWVSSNPSARRAAGRKLTYASVGPLAVVAGLLLASLLW
ncbi:hypothetical protein PVAP13_5KG111787 [Panicum virgatum]|uniref:Uncharacterized protein n=1 Tax=Panicum virgatum TaxID=38727 RepID=A0A8T0SBS1_PANVG|nr:hypothetical protein PVAP13_5KG111787 [Panicum virgatum]